MGIIASIKSIFKKVIIPKKGSLIKFKTKYSPVIEYVRVDGFYDIHPEYGGGRGFNYTMLGGTGYGSTPEDFIEKVKQFASLKEMQEDIDNKKQKEF